MRRSSCRVVSRARDAALGRQLRPELVQQPLAVDARGARAGERAQQRPRLRATEGRVGHAGAGAVAAAGPRRSRCGSAAGGGARAAPRARSAAAVTAGSPSASSTRSVSGSTSVSSPIASARAARALGPSVALGAPCSTSRPQRRGDRRGGRRAGQVGLEGPREQGRGPGRSRRLHSMLQAEPLGEVQRPRPAARRRAASRRGRSPTAAPPGPGTSRTRSGRPARAASSASSRASAGGPGRPRGERQLTQHGGDLVGVAVPAGRGAGRLDAGHGHVGLAAAPPRRGRAGRPRR